MPSVQRPGPRTAKAVAASLLVLLPLTGCGAGAVTQTASQASAVNGYAGQVGSIMVRDATIQQADAPLAGAAYQPGGAAPLAMTIVNVGSAPDTLLQVSSPVAGSGQVVGDAVIPGGTAVTVGNNAGAGSQTQAPKAIQIKLNGLVGPIRAGLTYPVTFKFQRAGTLTAQLPVGYPTGANAERPE
jgi:copper(I)-binding protein